MNQIAGWHFLLFAEVDHLAIKSITNRTPLVFLNQQAPVEPKSEVPLHEQVELSHNSLKQRGNRNCIVHSSGDVADAKLKSREERMRPHVPPNLLAVVDTTGLNKQVDIPLETSVRIEVIRNVSARKLFEDFAAIRLETGVVRHPKRRRGGQRQYVRQKVARCVHDMNCALPIRNAHVNVQAKDQQRTSDGL